MKKPIHINKLSYAGFGLVSMPLLKDTVWITLGFNKRPKRGKIPNLFKSKERNNLEAFLIKELFAFSIIDIADSLRERTEYQKDGFDYRVLFLIGVIIHLVKNNYFPDYENCLRHIRIANSYTRNSKQISRVFLDRAHYEVRLSDKSYKQLIGGAINTFSSSDRYFGIVNNREYLNDFLKGFEPSGKLKCDLKDNEKDLLFEQLKDLIEKNEINLPRKNKGTAYNAV